MSPDVADLTFGDAPRSSVEILAEVSERITFATHQCDFPVIADLVVANRLETALENITLHLSSEPKVLGDRLWTIDHIAAHSEFRPRDRRVSIWGGMLDALTERMRAEVRLVLRQGESVLAESRFPIIALARNEWGGARFMPELIAAFVTPNDPAVQRLLKEASKHLEASGKSGSLEGYQSRSRKRSWEIVAGLWAAVCARGLTYAEPPASFGRQGQKIRLPSMIEEQGLATCLDTALLFAAGIEQAGLNSVVVFTEGHALAGAWLQPQTLPSLIVEDPMEIRKAIAQEELVLFETTLATAGHALPFSRAVAEGRRQVSEANEDAFIYAIDIRQARGRDIQPLSSLVRGAKHDPLDQAVRAAPPLDEAPDLPPFDDETSIQEQPQTPAERLDRWKRSLLDLSKRNRLLNLRASATAIPIFCPDPGLLENKIAEGKRVSIITPPERQTRGTEPDPDLYHLRTGEELAVKFAAEALQRNEIVANLEPKLLEKSVIELYRKAKADFEEGGANTLFLVLGMLRWSPKGDAKHSYRAPLLLLPVRLERRSAASKPYLIAHEDEPIFNLTLAQMLRQDFEIDFRGLERELPTDAHGVNVRLVWDLVRARIREVQGFEVAEEVVLSTFSFAKYLMWKDLAERTQTLKTSPFVRHVIDTPRDPYTTGASFLDLRSIDATIHPSEIMAPLNADSSQIVAIHASGKGGDFVLEGPPGTGKSETIGNLIVHNLGLGHSVLFVSEKMAALEVVYRRLSACGLGDFCLELHSAKANKRAVIDQLGTAWEKRRAYPVEEWKRKAEQLAQVRDQLNKLVQALHAPGPAGISPRDAIGRSVRYRDVHRLRLDWATDQGGHGRASSTKALADLEDLARRLGQQFSQLNPDDLSTFKEIAHTEWSFAWLSEIVSEARSLSAAIEDLVQCRRAFLERLGLPNSGNGIEESAALAEIAELVPECATVDVRFALEPAGVETTDHLEMLSRFLEEYRAARQHLSTEYPDHSIPTAPLKAWSTTRATAEAKIWPMKAIALRQLRHAIRAEFGFDKTKVSAPERDLPTLMQLADIRAKIDEVARRLPQGTPWTGLETDLRRCGHAIEVGRRLRGGLTRYSGLVRGVRVPLELLSDAICLGRDHLAAGMPIPLAAAELTAAYSRFAACYARFRAISAYQSQDVRTDRDLDHLARTAQSIVARERRLNLWCAWVSVCREAREIGLGALVTALESGAVSSDQTIEALRTAYACWVAPILIDARPELNRFSSVRHEDLIQTFRNLDRELSELTAAYIRAKLSTDVPARDSGGSAPGYAVLSRELQKRMRHKPVRQLVADMGNALTKLTPCLLMSPLSVAQFLPAETQAFDLVVFDEASQITVPDAIGAIARGKRCIVVGDPRQMPPTRFFERGAEDDENEEVQDLESILDEALAARVPHHRLTGHYRSRHESLISFSNHAYYQGTLVTYPSADTRDTAVTFRRTNGVYAKGKSRTNEIEARAVIDEVVRRLRDPKLQHLSIGVVTLNSEQQRLIEDLLDQQRRADPELERFFGANAQEPVFIKNLETVQGDQRDVILLSVGYGPTEPGAKTMSMNFGPLNRIGGERRLNVAITRATTEVVAFASFDPAMIDLTRTSAQAVKDLKHYLDFAARGPVAIGEAVRTVGSHNYDSDFEMAVAERLQELGWVVRTQIGVSKFRIDLGVVHPDAPGRFLAGLECDGATYHSSPSARDRDRVRHIVLEQLGWRLLRVWSTDYFLDPAGSVEKLDAHLNALLQEDRIKTTQSDGELNLTAGAEATDMQTDRSDDSQLLSTDARQNDQGLDVARDDQVAEVTTIDASRSSPPSAVLAPERMVKAALQGTSSDEGKTSALDPLQFYEPSYLPHLKSMTITIIDSEGPITFKRLSDLIARAHGFQRTGKQISSAVWQACAHERRFVPTADGHKVFWPHTVNPEPSVPYRGPTINGDRREWRDVPHPEKIWLVRQILNTGTSDPARAIADAIGFTRVTAPFRTEISELIRHLGAEGSNHG